MNPKVIGNELKVSYRSSFSRSLEMGMVTHGDLNLAHRYPKNGSKAFIL